MRPFACAGRDSERTKPTHGPQVYHAAAYLCCASSCVHAHVCERNRAPSLLPPNPLRDASRQKKGVGKQEERGSLYLLFRKKLVLRAMYPKQRKDGGKKNSRADGPLKEVVRFDRGNERNATIG